MLEPVILNAMKGVAFFAALLIVFSSVQAVNVTGQETAPEQYKFVTKWGSQTNNAVLQAGKLATDGEGNLYVIRGALDLTPVGNSEPVHLMVVKYDSAGLPVVQFGPYGEGYGQLSSPSGIAADPSGQYVYVSDSAGKVLKFRSDGTFVKQWGSQGQGDGEFSQFVQGLAVDSEGNVYAADAGNARIQKFSSEGEFLGKWGSDGSEDGQFAFPYGVAIAPDGSIYVDDFANRRIQKFTHDGQFILKWTPGDGDPIGLAVDSEGSVYVVPQSFGKVKKYTANGQFLMEFNATTLEPADLYSPIDVAVDSEGNIYTALQNAGVQKFDRNGNLVMTYSSTKEGTVGFRSPIGIAVDSTGHVYVLDDVDMRIQKFSSSGQYLAQWPFAVSPGESAYDIAVDYQGNVYLAWQGVKIFTPKGISMGELKGSNGSEILGARALATDSQYVYVASNYQIQKFTLDGVLVSEWDAGDTGELSGEHVFIDDIAVDSIGRVYALGFYTNVVNVFDSEGNALNKLDFSSDIPVVNGQPANAFRVAIDRHDKLYVGYFDGTIRKYDSDGKFIVQVASRGSENGQTVFPTGIAFDNQSDLMYVADHGNYRVQVFGKQTNAEVQPLPEQTDSGLVLIVAVASMAGVGAAIMLGLRKIRSRPSRDGIDS